MSKKSAGHREPSPGSAPPDAHLLVSPFELWGREEASFAAVGSALRTLHGQHGNPERNCISQCSRGARNRRCWMSRERKVAEKVAAAVVSPEKKR